MKWLIRYANKPIIGPFIRDIMKRQQDKHAEAIGEHFAQYFETKFATSKIEKEASYRVRHQVYCEELEFEPKTENALEMDEFDQYSSSCVIYHKGSESYCGTVRIVRPSAADQMLPIEKFCLNSIDQKEFAPSNFSRDSICEISRLAVHKNFRRRRTDKYPGASTGAIDEQTFSESEIRCFPFIAVGLYLAATRACKHFGLENVFVMMEPRLARSMRMVGINFKQVGKVTDYHGERAPYYINPDALLNNLTPGFMALYKQISKDLEKQLK